MIVRLVLHPPETRTRRNALPNVIVNTLRDTEIRRKLAFTVLLLFAYRLGSFVPVPGVNVAGLQNAQSQLGGSNIFGLLNLFSGGGLSRVSLFALGIAPYITASIVIQLLGAVMPSMIKLRREGEVGEARLVQYVRYLTVALAAVQSIGYVILLHSTQAAGAVPVFERSDAPHLMLM